VLLDSDELVLRARIAADQVDRNAEQRRLDHVAAYESARSDSTFFRRARC
jgi:hypothetical protein